MSCKHQKFHNIIKNLNYQPENQKCKLLYERIKNTGILSNFVIFFIYIFNLFSFFKLTKLLQKNIFFKFLSGIIVLIFESDTSFDLLTQNQKMNSNTKQSKLVDRIYDTIIVGSGPGGSVAAKFLTEKGENVLIIEQGYSYLDESIKHHSYIQSKLQFKNEGMSLCYGNIPMLFAEGATYGGGSEVNSGLYFKLAGPYKESILSSCQISNKEWSEAELEIEKELKIQLQPKNKFQFSTLVKGSSVEDLICEEIPRWRTYHPIEEHQSMQKTYLAKAAKNGLENVCGVTINKLELVNQINVLYGNKKDGKAVKFLAKKIILSAGTIGSPKILKNSNYLTGPVNFNFHPMNRCVAEMTNEINGGDLFPPYQSWTKDYNHKFGYAVSTPPYLKATLSSVGIFNFDNLKFDKLASFFSSTTLKNSVGRLFFINKKAFPVIYISKSDKQNINKGFELLKTILVSGGAKNIWPKSGISPMTSVHIFGSLPIGNNIDIGQNGELISNPNVKVCDASLLPSAPWGNPQGVIMALNLILLKRWYKIYGE